ncbi:hypothetical protein [Actinokineospora pegani]|uniref:hypothetical protein n=1 Tax=Actinokineospora pegani TaxID=2654637 RepID=UPI0012EAF091|nr:hypothetical protein [Actinokineospora pegani]
MIDEPTTTHHDHRSGGTGEVRGNHNRVATDPRGTVYQGDIYNNWGNPDSADPVPRREVSATRLDLLAKKFAPPSGIDYARAQAKLRERGAVLITGQPGSGRHTAGLMLLHNSGKGTGSFQEVAILPENGEFTTVPQAQTVQDGERLLLDLTTWNRDELRAVEPVVKGFHAAVEATAYLVIVLPRDHGDAWRTDFVGLLEIGWPNRRLAFQRHLAAEEVALPDSALLNPDLADRLREGSMGEIAVLAQLVRAARDRRGGKGDPQAWVSEAVNALTDQRENAEELVGRAADGRGKTLLFTAAMLHGSSVDELFFAEQKLLTQVDYPSGDTHALDQKDFAQRLGDARIEVNDSGRVGFPKLGLDAALRRYFWSAMPAQRPAFREWVAKVVATRGVTGVHKRDLVERFADQALASGSAKHVVRLAERWTYPAVQVDSDLYALAEALLFRGLTHERQGQYFRQQFYAWATSSTTNPPLARLVIRLSEDVLAPTYVDQALVRLHHLTAHGDRSVRAEAVDALLRLSQAPSFWHRVMYRLHTYKAGSALPESDRALFTGLAGMDVLPRARGGLARAQVRDQLAHCWRALLAQPLDTTPVLIGQWLGTGDQRLWSIIVEAADGRPQLLSALHGTADRWRAQADEPLDQRARQDVVDALGAAIDRALGLDFLEPDLATKGTGQ